MNDWFVLRPAPSLSRIFVTIALLLRLPTPDVVTVLHTSLQDFEEEELNLHVDPLEQYEETSLDVPFKKTKVSKKNVLRLNNIYVYTIIFVYC